MVVEQSEIMKALFNLKTATLVMDTVFTVGLLLKCLHFTKSISSLL